MRQLITNDIVLLGDGRFLRCCCYSILLGVETLFPIQKKHSDEKFIFECLSLLVSKSLPARDERLVFSWWTYWLW